MKKLLMMLLLGMPPLGYSQLQGKINLTPSVQPMLARELHDGQWLAGIAKPDIWSLTYQGYGNFAYSKGDPVVHVGLFQLWNAEKGNASFGPILGLNLPANIGTALQGLGDAFGFSQTFKPASFVSSMLSLDGFGGIRPIHTADVNGFFVYGIAATLTVKFGVSELGSAVSPQVPHL